MIDKRTLEFILTGYVIYEASSGTVFFIGTFRG